VKVVRGRFYKSRKTSGNVRIGIKEEKQKIAESVGIIEIGRFYFFLNL
jgi:hypothetical protein